MRENKRNQSSKNSRTPAENLFAEFGFSTQRGLYLSKTVIHSDRPNGQQQHNRKRISRIIRGWVPYITVLILAVNAIIYAQQCEIMKGQSITANSQTDIMGTQAAIMRDTLPQMQVQASAARDAAQAQATAADAAKSQAESSQTLAEIARKANDRSWQVLRSTAGADIQGVQITCNKMPMNRDTFVNPIFMNTGELTATDLKIVWSLGDRSHCQRRLNLDPALGRNRRSKIDPAPAIYPARSRAAR